MRFTLNGAVVDVTREQAESRLAGVLPEPVQTHGVRVGGRLYPVKQALEAVARIGRRYFTSDTARRHLAGLGFEIVTAGSGTQPPVVERPTGGPTPAQPQGWPWEGRVQELFGAFL
jgi:hypothetical protein